MKDCIFCRIAKGEIPSNKVYESGRVIAFGDINPQAPHHYLIIPKKHIRDTSAMGDEDTEILSEIFQAARALAKEKNLEGSGYRLVINQGRNAGQAVFHLHVHLLGGRPMGWPPG